MDSHECPAEGPEDPPAGPGDRVQPRDLILILDPRPAATSHRARQSSPVPSSTRSRTAGQDIDKEPGRLPEVKTPSGPGRRPVLPSADPRRQSADPGHPRHGALGEAGRRRRQGPQDHGLKEPPITLHAATPTSASSARPRRLNIQHALDLYQAETGEFPKTYAEFMEKIIKANNIALPTLPFYQEYGYDLEHARATA